MTGAVLDASALLALLFDEPGASAVSNVVADGAVVSAVNLAEVATVLVRHGLDPGQVLAPVRDQVPVHAFDDVDAARVAALYPKVSAHGLSLGDRACLALAQRVHAPAVTAERVWDDLSLDVDIRCVRAPLR